MIEDVLRTIEGEVPDGGLRWMGIGGAFGAAVLHPFAMAVEYINASVGSGLAGMAHCGTMVRQGGLLDAIASAFSPEMIPMTAMYTSFCGIVGYVYGKKSEKIKEQRKLLEDENAEKENLLRKLERDEQVMRLYEAGLEHDWKNYLMVILGQAQLLELGNIPDEDRKSVNSLRLSAETLHKSIMGKLELVAVSNPGSGLREKRTDLYDTIYDSIARSSHKRSDVKIYVDDVLFPNRACKNLLAEYNPALILTVMNNLVSNGKKYGSTLRIYVSEIEDRVRFQIKDDGIGMTPEQLDSVFEVGRLSSNARGDSSHIGMPYSQLVIERHGGRIWAESGYGKGTSFFFEIPKRQAADSVAAIPVGEEQAGEGRSKGGKGESDRIRGYIPIAVRG